MWPIRQTTVEPRSWWFQHRPINAPEWTRTTTSREAHKALNLIRPCHIRPPAARSSVLYGFPDTSDTSDKMTCVRDVSREWAVKVVAPGA